MSALHPASSTPFALSCRRPLSRDPFAFCIVDTRAIHLMHRRPQPRDPSLASLLRRQHHPRDPSSASSTPFARSIFCIVDTIHAIDLLRRRHHPRDPSSASSTPSARFIFCFVYAIRAIDLSASSTPSARSIFLCRRRDPLDPFLR